MVKFGYPNGNRENGIKSMKKKREKYRKQICEMKRRVHGSIYGPHHYQNH